MTVLAVVVTPGGVTMGADGLVVGGDSVAPNRCFGQRKIGRVPVLVTHGGEGCEDEFALVAAAGSTGLGQLARYELMPPPVGRDEAGEGLDEWAWAWAMALAAGARERHLTDDDDAIDGCWLVAFRGRAWVLTAGGITPIEGMGTLGSGGDFALGVLWVSADLVEQGLMPAREAIETAIACACELDATCGGDLQVEELPAP